MVLSKVANGTTTLLLNIYAVHFLAPAEFGALTLCTTFLVLLDGLFGAAIDLAVIKLSPPEADSHSRVSVERAAISLKALGCISFGTALVTFAHPIGRLLLHQDGARPLFLAWSIAATAVMVMRSSQLALQVRHYYKTYACIELLNTASRISLVVWVMHHGHRSSVSVMTCYAIGSVFAFSVGLLTLIRLTQVRWWWGLQGASKLIRAGRTALATYGFSAMVSRLDIILLAILANPAQLGIYGSAMTLASIPEIASTYLAPAFLPRIVPYCRQGVFLTFFKRFHILLYGSMILAYCLAILLIPKVGPLILPPKYIPALPVIAVLLPGTLATASIFPLSLNLLMLRNSKVFLIFDCMATPTLIIAYWLAADRKIIIIAAITSIFRIAKTCIIQIKASRYAVLAQEELLEALPVEETSGFF